MEEDIIFVDEAGFKEAYEKFARSKSEAIDRLYEAFARFNELYWAGELPRPIIELSSQLSKRTLAQYRTQTSYGCEHYFAFNEDFYVLNPLERVEQTLKHEMIHLYLTVNGKPAGHNRHFKKETERIGIPCQGRNMSSGPALMPNKSKSTLFLFSCGCQKVRARELKAVCTVCHHEFKKIR